MTIIFYGDKGYLSHPQITLIDSCLGVYKYSLKVDAIIFTWVYEKQYVTTSGLQIPMHMIHTIADESTERGNNEIKYALKTW